MDNMTGTNDASKNFYNLSPDEILEKFSSSFDGLSEKDASIRIKKYGINTIKKKKHGKWVRLVFNQFNDALVWILLVAALLAYFFGEIKDVLIILIIVLANAAIGFFQEFKAERILEGLRVLTADTALVIRQGEKKQINSQNLVPGDVVFISDGDNVPADGYLLEEYNLKINSFVFTGESKPRNKKAEVLRESNLPLADIENMVFSGESVASGEAKFLVVGTGMNTELGRIAHLVSEVKEELTPLQKSLRNLGRRITLIAIAIGISVILVGQYFDLSLYQNFLFALALSVAVVPEGLPAAVSVTLSLGMKRLLKKNVLAKKLNAVEALGSVTFICTDKTGTITRNELTVTRIILGEKTVEVSGIGYVPKGEFSFGGKSICRGDWSELDLILKIGTLCNDANLVEEGEHYKIVGDPTEGAIIVAGKKMDSRKGFYERGERKITENPFSSERMMMSVVYENKRKLSYVKGSPDILLKKCSYIIEGGKINIFSERHKERIKKEYNKLSSEALRVLAFAYRDLDGVSKEDYLDEIERNLVWVGMMAMIDPPRQNVAKAIKECLGLGLRVIMITGDYEITAQAIAQKVGLLRGLDEELAINGKTLKSLKDEEVFQKIQNGTCIFARIAPEQKLRIAKLLQKNGEVIAMTGDGVNDAPALKRADIGIAMGIMGTDVSKESADMILLDDNFASIVKGIKEGRTIFKNLKKFIHYIFTSNASELFTVVLGVLLQIPAPISAVQILAVDLGTDIFPSLSLGLEPAEPDPKNHKIKREEKNVLGISGMRRIIYIGLIMAVGATITFLLSMFRGGWHFGASVDINSWLYLKSTTAAYAVISMTQMANLLESRSARFSIFQIGFFRNWYALAAIVISFGILMGFMYLPLFQTSLKMVPIDVKDWMGVVISVVVVFLFEELRKMYNIRKGTRSNH